MWYTSNSALSFFTTDTLTVRSASLSNFLPSFLKWISKTSITLYSLPNFSIIVLFNFSSFIAPTKTSSAFILFLSKDTAISRPDNVADKTLFSTCALFSEVSCFLLLDESVLSEVTFGVSLLGTSCLFSGTVCPLGPSFLSVSFTDSLFSFLSSSFTGSLFSFLVSVTFSSLGVTF